MAKAPSVPGRARSAPGRGAEIARGWRAVWVIWLVLSMLRRSTLLGHVLAIAALAWLLEGEAHDPAFFLKLMDRFDSLPVIHQLDGMVVTAMQDFTRETARRILEALSGRGGGDIPDPPPAPPRPRAPIAPSRQPGEGAATPLLRTAPPMPNAPAAPSPWQPRVTVPGGPPFWPAVPPAPYAPAAPAPWRSQPSAGGTTIVVPPSGPAGR